MSRRTALALALLWAVTWLVNRSLVAVRGPSMLPTLVPGERLLTLPSPPAPAAPGRVVVVEDPAEPGHLVVKRVAEVDAAEVVVLGDHPAASTDSRVWGPLPRSAVRRVAVARWPRLSRTGLRTLATIAVLLLVAPAVAGVSTGAQAAADPPSTAGTERPVGRPLAAPDRLLADATPDDVGGSHPAELQPAPEDGQEPFGQPADERTEQLVRWLRAGLGIAVGIVVLLLVIVVPLRLRRRQGAPEERAGPGPSTEEDG